ncbi:Cytochrome c oxidase subunit [Thalictrum thalictroides]|uniref:Cytochrome c oxidase subunit n=1 Tax=Thalictrum thalictroides TaxID=46969 RepID=A0A7J6V849_THATH|nr:Cytochrome c oxidase subunit [Thalictrum thalictroides]
MLKVEHRAECNPYLYFFSGELAFLSFSQVFPICLGKPDMLTKLLEVSSVGAAFLLPMFAGLAPPSSSVPSGSIGSFNVFKEVDIRSGLHVGDLFLILGVLGASGGEIIPYSSPANSSSEDSADLQVFLEPWPVTHNLTFSMRNRILTLENTGSIFLLDKERGVYWAEVKNGLDNCSSQREYTRLLEFENRDLKIRELKHESYSLFKKLSTDNPALFEDSPYKNAEEAILALTLSERNSRPRRG